MQVFETYARIWHEGVVRWARRQEDSYEVLPGAPWYAHETQTLASVPASAAVIGPPAAPDAEIILSSKNSRRVAEEMQWQPPTEPTLFLKPRRSVCGPESRVVMPPESSLVTVEAELAAVMAQPLFRASPEEAEGAIFGFTSLNDVTARDIQKRDVQVTRAKGYPGFCPVGPTVVRGWWPESQAIRLMVNGRCLIEYDVSDFFFPVQELVSFASKWLPLEPGDIITFGAADLTPVERGDVACVQIDGLDDLCVRFA